MEAKKTPLYDEHVKLGGKMVEYAGWALPIQYEGLVPEHETVRNAVGIFDVSHMGSIVIKGKDALPFVNYLMTNDLTKIVDNQVMYSFMCNPDGGVVDDLLVFRYNEEYFYLVPNAANIDKDFKWINDNKGDFDVEVENQSEATNIVAVQGPNAEKTVQKLTDYDLSSIGFFRFASDVEIAGVKCLISRTGYTGEDGFEIFAQNDDIIEVWNGVLEAGKEDGVKPVALGCRDTLRFEAALPLYGNEIDDEQNPLEAGFKFFVKLDKEVDFIGKEALNKLWEEGLKEKLVGFELLGKGIPRQGYEVYKDGEKIGRVTTGYMAPTIGKPIGNAIISAEHAKVDTEIEIKVRKKFVPAKVIKKNFLKEFKDANK